MRYGSRLALIRHSSVGSSDMTVNHDVVGSSPTGGVVKEKEV